MALHIIGTYMIFNLYIYTKKHQSPSCLAQIVQWHPQELPQALRRKGTQPNNMKGTTEMMPGVIWALEDGEGLLKDVLGASAGNEDEEDDCG